MEPKKKLSPQIGKEIRMPINYAINRSMKTKEATVSKEGKAFMTIKPVAEKGYKEEFHFHVRYKDEEDIWDFDFYMPLKAIRTLEKQIPLWRQKGIRCEIELIGAKNS